MQAIKLTKEHHTKLEEITKNLFPEYDDVVMVEGDVDFGYYDENFIWLFPNEGNLGRITMYWFEFCLLHLIPKLTSQQIELPLGVDLEENLQKSFIRLAKNNEIHPIDYLHNQWFKLK